MSATFSFQIDRPAGLIRITMAGLFTRDDVGAFLEARREAHETLGWPPNLHMTLNDLRGMKIQSQEIVEAFRDMLAAPQYRSRRLAFVAARTLTRSQLMRALANRHARCFESLADAEDWLFAEEIDRAPLRSAAA